MRISIELSDHDVRVQRHLVDARVALAEAERALLAAIGDPPPSHGGARDYLRHAHLSNVYDMVYDGYRAVCSFILTNDDGTDVIGED